MAAKRTLLKNGTVLSLDKKVGNFNQADVLIEDTKIAAVGPNLSAADAEMIDASNIIVMPGFIDTHRHLWEGILRNIGTDIPLEGEKLSGFCLEHPCTCLPSTRCLHREPSQHAGSD